MLTLVPIHTPEHVLDHFAPVHRYGGAARHAAAACQRRALALQRKQDRQRAAKARIDLTAVVARARQRGKAPPRPVSAAIAAAAPPNRVAGC